MHLCKLLDDHLLTGLQPAQTLLHREFVLWRRNLVPAVFRVGQAVVLSATIGLLFWQRSVTTDGAANLIGAMAFSLNFINMQSIAVVSSTFERKAIFYKQRDNFFYPGYSILMPQVLTVMRPSPQTHHPTLSHCAFQLCA